MIATSLVIDWSFRLQAGWKAKVMISLPSASVANGIIVSSTSIPT